MFHDTRSNHVERNISQTIEKVLAILHNGAVIRMLPNRSLVSFPPIQLLCESPGDKVHHQSNALCVVHVKNQMYMIAGDAEGVQGNIVALDGHA
jgi:hypothetical protein